MCLGLKEFLILRNVPYFSQGLVETLSAQEITALVEILAKCYPCECYVPNVINENYFWNPSLWKFVLAYKSETWELEYDSKKQPLEHKDVEPPLKSKILEF